MRLCILGPVEIHDELRGRRIAVSGQKQAALLATLIVRANRTVSADRLIEELWGADPPANAANALSAHVKRLRQLIAAAGGSPDRIVTRAPGYRLTLEPGETDAEEFLTAVASARSLEDASASIPLLRKALSLWRGPAFDGSVLGDICAAESVVLDENRLAALETLYDASLRAGHHQTIVPELEETLAAYPLRERLYIQLMLALHRSDRQSDAIAVYDRARRRLLQDLGVEPGPALRATMRSILTAADISDTSAEALSEELAVLQRRLNTLARRQAALLRMLNDPAPLG